jgi:hypothetical protein
MYWKVIAMLMAATVGQPVPQSTTLPQSAYLTRESINEAVDRGRTTDVAPYGLSQRVGPPRSAVVYTPFIRVALAAMHARRRGNSDFDPSRLPEWMTNPLVYVAFSAPCGVETPSCEIGGEQFDLHTPFSWVLIAPTVVMRPPPGVGVSTPKQIIGDMTIFESLGGPPFGNVRLVAAFEPEAFRPGLTVFAQWPSPSGKTVALSGGRISETDLYQWR